MTEQRRPGVVWLRDDLRVTDNPALRAAVESGAPLLLVHVLDGSDRVSRPLGGASRWWLHHSLAALGASVARRGGRLVLRRGDAEEQVLAVVRETGAEHVYWNRRYARAEREQDARVAAAAAELGVGTHAFAANVLHEPGSVRQADGSPFGVFSPYWRAAQARGEPRAPHAAPDAIPAHAGEVRSEALEELGLLPTAPDWAGGLRETWTPGEKGAHRRLDDFVHARLEHYAAGRDIPSADASSRLSPHLKFGELSPYQVWHRVRSSDRVPREAADKFLSELGWREFNYTLLADHPGLGTKSVSPQFDRFPWAEVDPARLRAWQRGRTGVPLVDAGMRELWHTGYMHNRVRMVTASFLVKNLRYDWRLGEQWFWDTLVDADPANNTAQWQWVAGSGADAAPFFRVFNPVVQAQKFDPAGEYIKKWVPELRELEGAALHQPWAVRDDLVATARHAGRNGYPLPIVDLKQSRQEALDAYERMRSN